MTVQELRDELDKIIEAGGGWRRVLVDGYLIDPKPLTGEIVVRDGDVRIAQGRFA